MIKQIHHSHILRNVLLISLGGVLVWQVVTKSFAAYQAYETPELALNINASEPVALVNLADKRLNPAPTETVTDAPRVSQTTSTAQTQSTPGTRDGLAAWAVLAIKATRHALSPENPTSQPTAKAAPQLTVPPVSDAERNLARAQAELALVQDPLNARALRILGQLADSAGDNTKATQLMQAAANRSWSESVAVYWLMLKSLQKRDYAKALRYADAFLRKRPQFMAQAMPILVRVAEDNDEKAVGALKTLLMSDPPWRSSFFSKLPAASSDARTPLQLLLSVKETTSPPTVADLRLYLNFLIKQKFYGLAYYTWLQFLPPEQLSRAGFLTNGSFEEKLSGLPFDWVIDRGSSGVTTEIAVRPELDGEQALYLEFGPGRANFRGVSQLLMLAPGAYELKATYKGEIIGRRGLQWTIACAGAPRKPIGRSQMFLGTARTWTDLVIPFTVPDAECPAQKLHLSLAARSESERLVSGSIWYDEMQISRVAKTDVAEQTLQGSRLNREAPPPPGVAAAKAKPIQSPSPRAAKQSQTAPQVKQ